MSGQRIGSLIAATFGLVYVAVNTGALPSAVAWTLRALAVLGFAAIAIALWRGRNRLRAGSWPRVEEERGQRPGNGRDAQQQQGSRPGRSPFGRAYWTIVVIEVLALFGGLRVLAGPLNHPEGGVAWVSFVVGVHFFALAAAFHAPFFNWLGAAVTLCGVIGLTLVFTGAGQAWIDTIAGVVPGALLLAFGWWGANHTQLGGSAGTTD